MMVETGEKQKVAGASFRMEPHHQSNQATSPALSLNPDSASKSGASGERIRTLPAEGATPGNPASSGVALLLDLSGNKLAAARWAEQNLTEPEIWLINKADLKWESRLKSLDRLRGIRHSTFAVFTQDVKAQSMRGAIMLFAALAGARHILLGDATGAALKRSRAAALLIEAPRLGLEMIIGYGVFVPLTWLFTAMLDAALALRKDRSSRSHIKERAASRAVLYLRATLSTATEGGMVTHVSGFASGARSLGHRLRFLTSGRMVLEDRDSTVTIEPSTLFSVTRALYEVWNNLVFTARCLSRTRDRDDGLEDVDLIYQRYSRFNWTGAALSLVTGRRLLLEFNGSEVWVSRRWDPVGLLWLLKRFEKLNLKAADRIFVVSAVDARNLLAAGVEAEKIVVNPNGVDAERFSPGCGGKDVRLSLGIDDRTVIGFLGTFGPWHGAPVLAEAVSLIPDSADCHFLFMGDGDERPITEAILERSGNSSRVTFTGRISHGDAPRFLDACDILVSPHVHSGDGSEFFGSPTKLFEYMAMARPVVASRLGQIAEVIREGENGLLVEPGDSRAIATAIEALLKDEPLRKRLGAAARQTVIDNYTWRHNAGRVFNSVPDF